MIKKQLTKQTNSNHHKSRLVLLLILLLGNGTAALRAQTYYVFYNATYGYLYNNNGTLTSSSTLQYDKSSAWAASGTLGTTGRTVASYTNSSLNLRTSTNNGGTVSLDATGSNWQRRNNLLCVRTGYTNYYLRTTNGTSFTTANNTTGAYYPYPVTLSDYPAELSDFSINSGDAEITAIGSYTYGHTNATSHDAYVNYYFNSTNHYVLSDNTQNGTTAPATTAVNTGYTWSLSSNANGYATVNSSTGEITVSSLPDVDMELILTCSVSSHGLTKTTTKTIMLQGTYPIQPTITRNGNDITIATSSDGATLYYTLDGSEPTASSTVYSAPFNVFNETYPLTIKAVAIRSGNASSVSSVTYNTQGSGISGGIVVLNDLEDHNWSYYSDPDCPIRSLSPADVKITYYGDGIVMSNDNDYTAGTSNYVTPGNTMYVGGAKVNVGGEDENTFVYYKTLERGDATTTEWTYSSSNQTSAASRCPYTTIPNPFQVRPTYGGTTTTNTADWTGWRGFQCWRLKSVSGGAVYSAASGGTALTTGAVINGETEIYFAPNSEYGMEVELEAVWAIAYVVKASSGSDNAIGDHSSVGCERNFIVLNTISSSYNFGGTTGKRITNIDRQVTVTNYLPNGVRGQNNDATYIRGAASDYNLTLQANTKFENVAFYMSGNTLTAANHNLIIGRGCSGTINYVSGINGNVTSPNYTLRIESGTVNYLSFLKGYSTGGNNSTDASGSVGGTPNIKGFLGCDYDRATNSGITDNLIVNNGAFYGYSVSEGAGITYSDNSFTVHVKSGKIGNSFTIDGSSYTADAAQSFYIGVAGQRVRGHRKIYVEGGQLASIAGGIDATQNQNNNSVTIRMTGGHVRGAVYGGAARSAAYGNRNLIVTGGSVTGWLGGGCNGEAYPAGQISEDTYGGITNGAAQVYFGGNATCGGTGSNVNINGSQGGIVFGAGKGVEGNTTSGRMAQGTTVVVADQCNIERNVYGGGNFGYAQTSTNVYVSGGTVQGSVFGGSNQNNGPVIDITMKGGTVEGGLYGGSNTTGTITDNVTMHIDGGQVGTSSTTANIHGGGYGQSTAVNGNVDLTLGEAGQTTPGITVFGDVYGGSALGTVNDATSDHTKVTLNAGTINGSLYGGALGSSSIAANVNGPVTVTVNGGSVKKTDANGANGSGAVYGCNNINGAPQNTVEVIINGTDPAPSASEYALYAVYGGGNQADYSYGTPSVTVNNCDNSIEYVYGGGNAAHITNGSTNVLIYGGNKIGNVFGGGNGTVTAANVSGNTNVTIHGGTIGRVFGGSNSQGTIGGSINVLIEKDAMTTCPLNIDEVYSGGNQAPSNVGSLTIGCMDGGDIIDYVYGGSNDADITGDIELNIYGGRINNVFGGNNTGHTVSGTIKVNVDWTQSTCTSNYLGNVYGGGNLAEYNHGGNYPEVNIINATVSGNVFGGGNGDPESSTQVPGSITGNPQVKIGNTTSQQVTVRGNVYGGGNAAKVVGNPYVFIGNKAKVYGNIYGGGNMGRIEGDTKVIVNGR